MTRRIHELGPVVLADVERVDPDGVCQDGLLDGVADDLVAREWLTGLVNRHLSDRVQSKLEVHEDYLVPAGAASARASGNDTTPAVTWAINQSISSAGVLSLRWELILLIEARSGDAQ